jgi:Sensors of blue-light using FAD
MSFDTAPRPGRSYIAPSKNNPSRSTVTAPSHRQLLYHSHLVAGVRYDVFSAICQVSRRRNAELSLTGVLLFDGHRFCQLLEGPQAAVARVRESIANDPRHEFMSVLVDRPLPAATTQEVWQAGYCGPDELDLLLGPERLDEDQAMAVFGAILTRADLSP